MEKFVTSSGEKKCVLDGLEDLLSAEKLAFWKEAVVVFEEPVASLQTNDAAPEAQGGGFQACTACLLGGTERGELWACAECGVEENKKDIASLFLQNWLPSSAINRKKQRLICLKKKKKKDRGVVDPMLRLRRKDEPTSSELRAPDPGSIVAVHFGQSCVSVSSNAPESLLGWMMKSFELKEFGPTSFFQGVLTAKSQGKTGFGYFGAQIAFIPALLSYAKANGLKYLGSVENTVYFEKQ